MYVHAGWLLVALFFGLLAGQTLAADGYFGRHDSGDQDE